MTAGIDARANDFQPSPVRRGESLRKKRVQFIPYGLALQIAVNDLIPNPPAFFVNAPADNLNFKAVVLHVNACGQHQHFFRDLAPVFFPPGVKVVRFDLLSVLFPRFPHFGICPRFEKFYIALFLLFVRC